MYGGQLPKPSHLVSKGESNHLVYPPSFDTVWAAYPDRDGPNPKKAAYRAYHTLATNGTDPDILLKCAEHYAQWANANDKAGTEYVMMARTFFGPDDHWREHVEPPKAKAPKRTDGAGYDLRNVGRSPGLTRQEVREMYGDD